MTTMRLAALLATTLMAAACATVPADAAQPAAGRPSIAPGDENCDVTIVFGSYAMGIDGESFTKVESYLKRRRAGVSYTATNWGREGEKTVCVSTRSRTAARKVFNDVRAMLPHYSRRGPVEVRSRMGQTFRTVNPGERRH